MNNFKFGRSSTERLNTCHPKLQILVREVLARSDQDISVLCGHRSREDQNKAYAEKRSKLRFPGSKHNQHPSMAVDLAPYPIDWKDLKRFEELADLVLDVADDLDLAIRWGGDWDMDGDSSDERFLDMPHFELC